MYEVYNNGTHEFINAYPALWEAICDVRWRLEKEGTIPHFEVPDFGIYALRSGVKYIEHGRRLSGKNLKTTLIG